VREYGRTALRPRGGDSLDCFFQPEDGIRDRNVTGVQTCALPILTTRIFTAEELAKYNGQDGNPAYVAIDGTVYDVSNVPAWRNGKHHSNLAGPDVSAAIQCSLHMNRVLESLLLVGKYTDDPKL